jgi:hypothetical protein
MESVDVRRRSLAFPVCWRLFCVHEAILHRSQDVPVNKENMWKIRKDDKPGQEVKRLAREHGWPDQGKFKWKNYLADVKEKRKVWNRRT